MNAAQAEIARVERLSTVHRTPAAGTGTMIWHEWGAPSATPLVLLHGGFGSWMHWIRNVEALACRYRVFAADIPGLGGSAHAADSRAPESIGGVVIDGVRALIGDAPFHMTGFSFGGLISGQVGKQLREQVLTMTLVGASGMALPRPEINMLRRHDDMSDDERTAALRHNLNALMLYHDASIDELALAIQLWNDAHSRVRSRRMSLGDSLARALPECTAKLGAVWGELDATSVGYLDLRRDLMRESHPESEARFRVVDNAGHWEQYEAADAFNDALLALLDDTPVDGTPD